VICFFTMKLVIFDWGRTLYDPETGSLFPETLQTLDYLKSKGYMLAIVALATAGASKIKERLAIIKEEKLVPYFVSVKFDVKNKDKMYSDTLSEFKILPNETVIVDDRVIRGIMWGNANGCKTIWVQNGKFSNELPDDKTGVPSHTIRSIKELWTIL